MLIVKNYFDEIRKIVSDIYFKKLSDDQIINLAGYGLIKQLDSHSDIIDFEQEDSKKYIKPIFNMVESDILYIHLYDFSDRSINFFEEYIKDININGLKCVLDLRRNVGGKLDNAIRLLKYFIPNKKIVDLKYRERIESYYTEDSSQIFGKTIVIINNETASASEVVAGSLQYYKKGLLIGQKSCGKSSIQQLIKLDHNIVLKLTVAYFYINGEYDINKIGLMPDIEFKEFTDIYSIKLIDDLEIGQVDFRISVIQQCLKDLKLYNYQCNGIYDSNTIEALCKFNKKYNIDSVKPLSQVTLEEIKRVYYDFCYNNMNANIIIESVRLLKEMPNE